MFRCARGVLFDMDGVLYNSGQPIEGAVETLHWVRGRSIPHLYVTNTSSRDRETLAAKLRGFGIEADASEILTPAAAAAEWLRRQSGVTALFVRPAALPDFAGLRRVADDAERGADFVVIGDLGRHWDYRTLNRAFRLLHYNPSAKLIALGMTRYWLAEDGISLDVAPFAAALEHATGRQPLVFGKPSERFFHTAARRLGLEPADLAMIGDDAAADVAGAQAAGLLGVLVKTGKFQPADLEGAVLPDFVWDSVAHLPRWWSESGAR